MKIKLSVLERIVLLRILPREGSFIMLRLVREAEKNLSFTDPEVKELKFNQADGGNLTWSRDSDAKIGEKNIEIGDTLAEKIVAKLKDLDSKEKLTKDLESLFVKFVKP